MTLLHCATNVDSRFLRQAQDRFAGMTFCEFCAFLRQSALLQLDGPVGVVQELFPALITLVTEVNVDEWIVSWPGGFLY